MSNHLSLRVASAVTVVLWIVAAWLPAPLRADPPATAQGANQNMVTEFKGTLKSFQRGVVLVTRDDGTEVMVQPPDDPSAFQFIATAKPAFLQRGMMVRFSGAFNPAGVPMSPITRVELFQPVGNVSGHAREQYIPGVYSDRRNRDQPPQAVAEYSVVGALMGLDASGAIMVQAGKRPVRAQLLPEAKFEIRFNNLSLAQEGDPVSVAGFYQPPDDTKVKAERVTITTDRVYGEPSADTPKRTSRRRTRRTSETEKDAVAEGSAESGDATAESPEAAAEAAEAGKEK